MAPVLVSPNALHSTRSMMRGLLLPGSRRVHAIGAGVTRLVLDSGDPVANGRDRLVIGTRTKAHDRVVPRRRK